MTMARHALLLALGAIAAVGSSSSRGATAAMALDGWYPCELDASSTVTTTAQCAIFRAPLCYDGVCRDASARTLDVFVKRLAATRPASRTPAVIMVQDGPSSAALDFEAAMQSISTALDGAVDVYSLDRRGAGRSTKLDCVAAQAQTTNSPGGVSISPEEVASCADELASKYAGDLSAFSLTSAAMDVQFFITNYLNTTSVFVYGAGASSAIVERLLHVGAPGITGFILDGVVTTSGSQLQAFPFQSKWDETFDAVGHQFLSLCDQDTACAGYFQDSTAATALRSLITDLDKTTASSACTQALGAQLATVFGYASDDATPVPTTAQAFRWVLGELLRRDTLRKFIPVVTYRLTRCSSDDVQVLRHFWETLATLLRTNSAEQDTSRNSLLSKLVAFSEFWESPTPTQDILDARFRTTSVTTGAYTLQTYCTFSKDTSTACAPFAVASSYAAPPLVYKKDAYWNVAATPPANASVLVLSGTLDPMTPHQQAVSLVAALKTTNKKLVVFEQATHGALWHTATSTGGATCGVTILASYVRQDGDLATTDVACVAAVPPLRFTFERELVATWLRASDAFDGTFLGTNATARGGPKSLLASPYMLAIIALCVLLGLALVVACVFVAKWRRARQPLPPVRGSTFCVDDPAYDEYYD